LPIYEAIKANTNIFMMLCGHTASTGKRSDTFAGNTITTFLSDYTYLTNGGSGWLRIMEFSPSNNLIRMKTYSPVLDQYNASGGHQNYTYYNMSVADGGYEPIATITNAVPGMVSSGFWQDLNPLTSYDWYVTVEDETGETRSAAWTFQTSAGFTRNASTAPSPFQILQLLRSEEGQTVLLWRSVGGKRYRVEYSDGDAHGGFTGIFTEIQRSAEIETDAAAAGTPSVQVFADDGSMTGGLSPSGARFYRVRQME
jgi:hypothetical protein